MQLLRDLRFQRLTTNEATIFQYFFFRLFLTSEIGESIDDDTKDEIQDDDDNDEEEQKIVNNTCCEITILWEKRRGYNRLSLIRTRMGK